MELKCNTYVIGDTHFMHDRIIEYCGRPFSPEEQDGIMIGRWNEVIRPEDLVIHMGDFALHKNSEKAAWIINALKGRKVLVKGNHDRKTNHWYLTNGFNFVCDSFVLDGILFTHRPIENIKKWKFNIHGHIHNKKLEDIRTYNLRVKMESEGASKERIELARVEKDPRYINTSVEVLNYRPVKLDTYRKEPT
jgi:calcineurin-like phosphoesterase family protein